MQTNRRSKSRFGGVAAWLTFAGLELICFLLIVTQNSRQRGIASQTWTVWSSATSGKVSNWMGIFSLRDQLDSLHRREADIRELLLAAQLAELDETGEIEFDTAQLELPEQYSLAAGRIVNKRPYSRAGNSFIINLGKEQGVNQGQGVIGELGPMGIVTDVGNKHARVMSVLDPDLSISAALANGVYGSLRWGGEDPRRATLYYIPDYVEPVAENDTIYTTGYSSVFPTRLPIGRSLNFEQEAGTGFWQIEVELFENYLSNERVFVVYDLHKPELDSLRNLE